MKHEVNSDTVGIGVGVRLKSGGPVMMVLDVHDRSKTVTVEWESNSGPQTGNFPFACLYLVEERENKRMHRESRIALLLMMLIWGLVIVGIIAAAVAWACGIITR